MGITIKIVLQFLIVLMACGCGRVTGIESDKVQLFNESTWLETSFYKGSKREAEVSELKRNVENYISTHPQIVPSIAEAMRAVTIKKGMSQEQVYVLAGEPNKKIKKSENEEIWIYKKDSNSYFIWNEGGARLIFKDGVLTRINFEKLEVFGDF